jgi:cell wall-associated NlpC family hydrolase
MTRVCTLFAVGVLAVWAAVALASPVSAQSIYTVKHGECVWDIAKQHGVPYRSVLNANRLSEQSLVRAGQQLTIPSKGSAGSTHAESPETVESVAKRTYVVRRGDTLAEIARHFGVTVRALAGENAIPNPNLIRAGRTLRIPASGEPVAQRGKRTGGNSDLVESALGYRGVPYRYAGMSTRGMDCSGLVARVLLNHGIRAPHNSAALCGIGEKVSTNDLKSGDLVFFNTRGSGISHVGIYMGDGKFVHASSSGGKVEVDRLDTGYYKRRLVGARRLTR